MAYSYVRFSTKEQARGDSRRRQTEATEKWCERNGIPLDTTLSLRDWGVSAFKGRHLGADAALGGFLELVRAGRVPRDSYLVIENLDRLSRQEERTALKLWIEIQDAGINIVQLTPETVFRHDKYDMVDIMRAILELSRGHSESRMKSVRTLANWDMLRRMARERGRLMTRRLPAWVRERGGLLELIPKRAEVVKRIFAMSANGLGNASIVKRLSAEKVPPFGGREPTEDGGTRKKDGDVYGCGAWRTAYVRSILSDRRAVGEYQPRDAAGKKVGDVIDGYYPPAVDTNAWYAARAGASGRCNPPGRLGDKVANLFGGLLVNARGPLADGSRDTYYAATRSEGRGLYRVLLNKSSVEGEAPARTFPLAAFEDALLAQLGELDPAKVLGSPRPGAADVIRGELNYVRERKAALALELLRGEVSVISFIAAAARETAAQEAALEAKLEAAGAEEAVPLVRTFADAQRLAGLLATADDKEDVRLRLRSELRRLVDSIHVLVVPRGHVRLAAVQVNFRASEARRTYLIVHRSAKGNQNKLVPAFTSSGSMRWPEDGFGLDGGEDYNEFDLRDPRQAGSVLRGLEFMPLERFLPPSDEVKRQNEAAAEQLRKKIGRKTK
jgi:DNA invertase Pin-like site-specific DNA recombinase